jgi:choline dehydrogenase-like flavoprotein
VESAQSLGIPFNDDYNATAQEGVAYPQFTIANGKRYSFLGYFLFFFKL